MAAAKKKGTRKAASDGRPFERRIARDLRLIYDPPELCEKIAEAGARDRVRLMKMSAVRRGQQGRGAQEPDLVTPTAWWIELQWAGSGAHRPMAKYGQAMRDIADHGGGRPWQRPVAICRLKGSPQINAWLCLGDMLSALGRDPGTLLASAVISIQYETFLEVLSHEWHRRQATGNGGGI